jgi:hypothetical protein
MCVRFFGKNDDVVPEGGWKGGSLRWCWAHMRLTLHVKNGQGWICYRCLVGAS